MDPLSLATGVAGLFSLGLQVAEIVTKYSASVKHAVEEIMDLRKELTALTTALKDLEGFLGDHKDELAPFHQSSALVVAFSSSKTTLQDLEAVFKNLSEASDKGKSKLTCRLLWHFRKDRVTQATDTIRRSVHIFSFSILIDNCKLLSKTSDAIAIIRATQDSSSKDVTGVLCSLEKLRISSESSIDMHQQQLTQIQKIQGSLSDEKTRKVLNWIGGSSDPSINHNAAVSKREGDTGSWFLRSDDFSHWTLSPGLLWLHGIPGCGKTVLCSSIIETMGEFCETANDLRLAYFYFDFQKIQNQDENVLLGSLIRQLSVGEIEIPTVVQNLYDKHEPLGHRPTTQELQSTLFAIIADSRKETYIIIDALDELPYDAGNGKRPHVLQMIEDMMQRGFANLHVLVTSRKEQDILECVEPLSSRAISIHGPEVNADISVYVLKCLENKPFKKLKDDLKTLIATRLSRGSQGMFRWAFCQIDALRRCVTPARMKKALNELPQTLDETYERILDEMSCFDQELASAILTWLVFSERPLTLKELATAAVCRRGIPSLGPDDRCDISDILNICRSLVFVSPMDFHGSFEDMIYLSHFSVKEYLISGRSKIFRALEDLGHSFIAGCCITTLLQMDFPELTQKKIDDNILSKYAAKFWPAHVKKLAVSSAPEVLDDVYALLQRDSFCYMNWVRIVNSWYEHGPRPYPKKGFGDLPPPLSYACFLGLGDTAKRLIDAGADVNEMYIRWGTSLHAASRRGWCGIVQMLLDNGADLNAYDRWRGTPLEAAAKGQREDVVRLLLQNGADANANGSDGHTNILQATLRSGWMYLENVTIFKLLIEHGAAVDAPAGRHGTALAFALCSEIDELALYMMERGAGGSDGGIDNILQLAAAGRCTKTVQLLLERGAQVNAPGYGGHGGALQAAAGGGSMQIVECILEWGADVNRTDKRGPSALQIAAQKCCWDIVARLVMAGANINACGLSRFSRLYGLLTTPLFHAVTRSHEETVRLLIRHGADVNLRDVSKGTPLQRSSSQGDTPIVQLLLDHGADINDTGGRDGSALHVAAAMGHYGTVELLLKRDADVNAFSPDIGTALMLAATRGRYEIVQLLLAHGADVHIHALGRMKAWMRHEYANALQAATLSGNARVVQLLIDSGADVNALDKHGGTALQMARTLEHGEVIDTLKSHGAIEVNDDLEE